MFAAHLRLLLRDHRAPQPPEPAAAGDPLLALLEDVRDGRTTAETAATRIRAGV